MKLKEKLDVMKYSGMSNDSPKPKDNMSDSSSYDEFDF